MTSKWEKSAERENERRRRAAPLLYWANLIERTTPAERKADIEFRIRNLEDALVEGWYLNQELANRFRSRCVGLLSAERIAELDQQRLIYPENPVYAVGMWRNVLVDLGHMP